MWKCHTSARCGTQKALQAIYGDSLPHESPGFRWGLRGLETISQKGSGLVAGPMVL